MDAEGSTYKVVARIDIGNRAPRVSLCDELLQIIHAFRPSKNSVHKNHGAEAFDGMV